MQRKIRVRTPELTNKRHVTAVEVCEVRPACHSDGQGSSYHEKLQLVTKKIKGELAERYRTDLLSQGWDNTQVSSNLTLSAKMFAISEFDNEEKVISQYLFVDKTDE